jgi:hypothetical protein
MTTDPRHQKDESALDQEIAPFRSTWTSLEQEEPPGLLDQAVINRARRELKDQGKAGPKRISIKWLGAFATAAVIVLALTIVLEQEQHAPVPAAEEADGLRLDSDGPTAGKREARVSAMPAKDMAKETTAVAEMKSAAALTVAEESPDETREAAAWIEQLLELKKTHQAEKLAGELARFRAAYPDYPLPPDLED